MTEHLGFNYFNVAEASDTEIGSLKDDWMNYMSLEREYNGQKRGTGQGIVITAGGLKYFTSAWILIFKLRESGCKLPIELWYYDKELTKAMRRQLKKLSVNCCDMKKLIDIPPHGFLMKPLSIMYSSFQEVLFLDADNIAVRDPTYLFEDLNYKKHGCLFWPDYWKTAKNNPIWPILNLSYKNTYEQDSGQLLIDKVKSWDQMQLCLYLNLNGDNYYRFIYGDKDTFQFAWLALKREYYMVPFGVGSCGETDAENGFYGNTMVQHDSSGNIIFLHRNLFKWDITYKEERVWRLIKRFKLNAITRYALMKSSPRYNNAVDLCGDTYQTSFDEEFPGFETSCLNELEKLRKARFYKNELMNFYFSSNRPPK